MNSEPSTAFSVVVLIFNVLVLIYSLRVLNSIPNVPKDWRSRKK